MQMSDRYEIIYVLSNKGMPGLIKIGKTQRKDLQARMSELYTTGVPFPFECLWAGEVRDCNYIEKIIHNAFIKERVNLKREFFNLGPEQVIPLLKEIAIKEITSTVNEALKKDVSREEQEAAKEYHRPQMNFEEMGIPIGAKLIYINNPDLLVTVSSVKKVLFEGEEYSLTALTRKLLDLSYNIQPSKYWLYEGKNLKDIYEETYTDIDS